MITADAKQALRCSLRQRRRNLTPEAQEQARQEIVNRLLIDTPFPIPKRIALTIAQDGELDLSGFAQACWARGINVCLPVLHSHQPDLWFAHYRPDTPLTPNRFGIPEPIDAEEVPPTELDWVLLPLVGFDRQGGRLGMGGGFYDRTFADSQTWQNPPKLIGVAHECQKTESIPRESWDVNLRAIVTPQQWYLPTD